MLTLFIADDEYFILERLKQLLDYPGLGYRLIGTAQNGHDALQFIERQTPDLAILDIKMPGLSGLEIAEQIYRKKYNTKVIILTSYDYFDFARQAVKYQVFSYLLKPINARELEKTLTDITETIHKEKERETKLCEYHQLQTELRLQRFLTAGISCAERKELSAQLPGIDAVRTVCCLKLAATDKTDIRAHAVRRALGQFPDIPVHYYMEYQDNMPCLFLKERDLPCSQLTRLQNRLQELFHTSVNIALVKNREGIDGLPKAYAQCLDSLQNTIFSGENTLVSHTAGQEPPPALRLDFHLRSSLSAALQAKSISRLTSLVHDAFLRLQQSPHISNLESLILEILSVGKADSLSESVSYTAGKLIDNYNSVDAVKDWCRDYLSAMAESSAADTADLNITKAIMEMIQTRYSDATLDLPYIAEKIGYTQNYISSIFKRNTGLTVVQYITQCRMNAAYLLLTAHHMPINQVYGEVGYSNPFYFSKRFKQYFGYSPSECPK